jgi:prepilin-type N-terminal cleavage/methylation domain-containing protein
VSVTGRNIRRAPHPVGLLPRPMPRTPMHHQHRAAFTLIEILVVLAIIGILAALAFPVITMASQASNRTKTVALLAQISAAVENFKTVQGAYPSKANMDPSDPTSLNNMESMGDTVGAGDLPQVREETFDSGNISTAAARLVYNSFILERALQAFTGGSAPPLRDAWKKRICFLAAKDYPKSPTEMPNLDTYQLWSRGPNGKHDSQTWKTPSGAPVAVELPWGGGDDIANWK